MTNNDTPIMRKDLLIMVDDLATANDGTDTPAELLTSGDERAVPRGSEGTVNPAITNGWDNGYGAGVGAINSYETPADNTAEQSAADNEYTGGDATAFIATYNEGYNAGTADRSFYKNTYNQDSAPIAYQAYVNGFSDAAGGNPSNTSDFIGAMGYTGEDATAYTQAYNAAYSDGVAYVAGKTQNPYN